MAKSEKKTLNEEQIAQLTFEQAVETLTEIVEKMESGEIPLQDSITQYEQGMAIISRCRKILQDAEKRIEQISAKKVEE